MFHLNNKQEHFAREFSLEKCCVAHCTVAEALDIYFNDCIMNSKYFVSYEALKARFPSFQYFICKRSVRTVHDAIEWIIDLFIMPSCVLFFLVCDLCSRFKLLFSSSGFSCERNSSFPFMGDAQCIIICWAANCCTKLSEMPVEGKREETKSWTNFLRHHSCVHLG